MNRPVPQYGKRMRPKTYSVAVYMVGVVVLFQFVMVISVFWMRAMVVQSTFRYPSPGPVVRP